MISYYDDVPIIKKYRFGDKVWNHNIYDNIKQKINKKKLYLI